MAESPSGTKADTEVNNEFQLVVFSLGDEEFGVEINNVQEIIRMPTITKIPQAPDYVKGVINLRGRIITVINLNTIMGMQDRRHDEDTRIIVANVNDTVMGFVVDSVSEVMRLPTNNVEQAPAIIASKINTEYLQGVGKMDRRLLILLNLEKFVSASRLHSFSNVSTAEGVTLQ